MLNTFIHRLLNILKAAHFGPTVLVVTASFLLALSQFSLFDSLTIAIAIFSGQLIVGWSNDVIDFPLDSAAKRLNKPLVSGAISLHFLKKLIIGALISTFLLSYFSPLGLQGTALHFLGILSATAYNFKFKSTIFSPLPYVISFGGLPWVIFLSAETQPPLWLYLGFILFSTAFHFLNVLKDLQWDINQGVLGLPQRLGKTWSVVVAVALISLGILNLTKR